MGNTPKTKNQLRVMKKLVKDNTTDFSQIILLVIQHIKENSKEFLRLLNKAGFYKIITISKPYSFNEKAYKQMQKFTKILIPTTKELEDLSIIKNVIEETHRLDKKFICLDLGGYFSRFFNQNTNLRKNLLGIIEDTKNGIWFDPLKDHLPVSIASVASSKLKDYVEHYFVAKAIIRNTENIMINSFQKTLAGQKILVCGYGKIGTHIAKKLKHDAFVTIYDNNPVQLLRAKIDGFEIITNLQKLKQFDVILGITGNFVLHEELLKLKNNTYLINGSTRQREFAFFKIKNQIKKREDHKNYSKISLSNGKNLFLLAQGYPVNFWNTESTPEFCLDAVFSEMFALLQKMVQHKLPPGFYPIETHFADIEKQISKIWLQSWL